MDSEFALTKFYRNFAWLFFGLAAVLLIFLIYLIWAKVTIFITSSAQTVSHEFVIEVKEGQPPPENSVSGKLILMTVEDSQSFSASGEKPLESDVVGEVTIFNNYSQEQTLVETTRLAAPADPDKVLVRLKKTVVVLPGQSIKVQVYPDKPEEFRELLPMRFIIPGLWGQLQEKIYAESSAVLSQEGQTVAVVTEADFTQAKEALINQLKQKAITSANEALSSQETLWPKLVSVESSEISFDVAVGEETAEFTAKGKLQAVVVVFDESQVMTLARQKLQGNLAGDKQLLSLNQKSLSYSIEGYDLNKKTATVRVYVEGSSALTENSEVLQKDKLTGKTAPEIKEYFAQFAEIEGVEVMFSPPWLKKTPWLKEKIEIKIEQ